MNYRAAVAALVAVIVGALLAACGGSDHAMTDAGNRVLVDALGDSVSISGTPRRVVSLAPNLTELVYALGAGDRLVGVTEFCDYPPEAKEKPQVAGFSMINLEAVIASRPDLIISNRGNRPEDLDALRRVGIPVFTFRIDSLPALVSGVETLGELLRVESRADSIAASWRERIGRVESEVARSPVAERPTVFFGGMAEPIYSVGPGSYVHDLLLRAGGRNIFGDMSSAWPRVDLETLVSRNPDVLVLSFTGMGSPAATLEQLREAPGWRSLSAVRNRQVYTIGDEIMRPGPRLIGALETLHRFFVDSGR